MPRGHVPRSAFKPGQSGNPSGRPKIPDALKKYQGLTSEELKRTIAKHFRLTKQQIAGILLDDDSPSLDLIIASTIVKAIEHGDIHKAEMLLLRAVGKIKEEEPAPAHDLSSLSMSQLTKMAKETLKEKDE